MSFFYRDFWLITKSGGHRQAATEINSAVLSPPALPPPSTFQSQFALVVLPDLLCSFFAGFGFQAKRTLLFFFFFVYLFVLDM